MPGNSVSSPNALLWAFFDILVENTKSAHEAILNEDRGKERQHTAVSVIISIVIIEVFLNTYYTLIADDQIDTDRSEKISKVINFGGLDQKN